MVKICSKDICQFFISPYKLTFQEKKMVLSKFNFLFKNILATSKKLLSDSFSKIFSNSTIFRENLLVFLFLEIIISSILLLGGFVVISLHS